MSWWLLGGRACRGGCLVIKRCIDSVNGACLAWMVGSVIVLGRNEWSYAKVKPVTTREII